MKLKDDDFRIYTITWLSFSWIGKFLLLPLKILIKLKN